MTREPGYGSKADVNNKMGVSRMIPKFVALKLLKGIWVIS